MAAYTSFPQTLTANGTITVTINPGRYFLAMSGDFGGGTLALTSRGVAVDNGSFTGAATKIVELRSGVTVLTLTGSTSPVLTVSLDPTMGESATNV